MMEKDALHARRSADQRLSVYVYILTPVDYFSSPAPALPSPWEGEGVEAFSDALADARVQAHDELLCPGGMWFAPIGEKSSC
jgi:hypothetical protein